MKALFYARLLLLKRHLPKIAVWMILPLVLTIIITLLFDKTLEDFRVPSAVVIEAENPAADAVIEGLRNSQFIDVEVYEASDRENVIRQLEQYQFDSVFIFPEDFEERLQQGERRNLLESYYTDRSFYYEPAKELLASLIQEQIGIRTTVDDVLALENELTNETAVTAEEITAEREKIQTETNLVEQIFYFAGEKVEENNEDSLNPWLVWAYLSLLITIFIFDIVTRETSNTASERFYFMKYTFKAFMLVTFTLLTAVMLFVDLASYFVIRNVLSADVSLAALFQYRLVINGIAFFMAYIITSQMKLYQSAIGLTIVLLVLDLLSSLSGDSVLMVMHPVVRFTEGYHNIILLVILLAVTAIWFRRDKHA